MGYTGVVRGRASRRHERRGAHGFVAPADVYAVIGEGEWSEVRAMLAWWVQQVAADEVYVHPIEGIPIPDRRTDWMRQHWDVLGNGWLLPDAPDAGPLLDTFRADIVAALSGAVIRAGGGRRELERMNRALRDVEAKAASVGPSRLALDELTEPLTRPPGWDTMPDGDYDELGAPRVLAPWVVDRLKADYLDTWDALPGEVAAALESGDSAAVGAWALSELLPALDTAGPLDPCAPGVERPPPLALVDGPACRGSVVPTGPPAVPWATPSRVAPTAA